jgi:hypothetical protein
MVARMPATRSSSFTRAAACTLIAGALVAAVACADAVPTAPAPRLAPMPTAALATQPGDRVTRATRRRLERAAQGLLYTSESDVPFTYVAFPAAAQAPLTEAAFRAAAGVPADSLVEQRTLEDFFARHIERVDPNDAAAVALVPRYRRLRQVLRTSVRGATVFRVGRIAIRCYVVGVDRLGNVVGLVTTAIET